MRRARAFSGGLTGGFTLIEVLVALAIVAIGMGAVMEALTSSANTAVYLQDKTFAEWVALNRLETVRLSGNLPGTGTSNDTIEYAGRNWEWQQKVTPIPPPVTGVVQIEIDVRPADNQATDDRGWYASATGFMGSAFEAPMLTAPAWSNNAINGGPVINPQVGILAPAATSTPTPTPTAP